MKQKKSSQNYVLSVRYFYKANIALVFKTIFLGFYVIFYLQKLIKFVKKLGENGKEDIPTTNGEKENNALDETALDWWSKYFASVETLAEVN